MKLKTIFAPGVTALFAVTPAIARQEHDHETADASATPAAGQKYTCTIHPDVVKDSGASARNAA